MMKFVASFVVALATAAFSASCSRQSASDLLSSVGVPAPGVQLEFGESMAFTCPPNATAAEIRAFQQALLRGEPLPAGWRPSIDGRVSITDTRVRMPGPGLRVCSVVIVEDRAVLASAAVEVEGVALATADREHGSIVDRTPWSIASLTVFVPDGQRPWKAKALWTGEEGSKHEFELKEPSER